MSEEPEGLGCGAVIAIPMMAALPLGIVYAASREAFVLLLWALGWGSVIWSARRTPKSVRDAANPAPPPVPERGCVENTQVSIVRDTTHPNRWIVAVPSRWMTEEIVKEVESD